MTELEAQEMITVQIIHERDEARVCAANAVAAEAAINRTCQELRARIAELERAASQSRLFEKLPLPPRVTDQLLRLKAIDAALRVFFAKREGWGVTDAEPLRVLLFTSG